MTVVPPGLVNVHHELDMPVGESNLCCLSVQVSGPRAISKEAMLLILEILWALPSSLPYVTLYIPGIPRYPSLTASAHQRSAPLTHKRKSPVPQ